jgi:bifunctional non-homologous end joining protein LigD
MQAVAVDRPFSAVGWRFEPKWDGWRCLARWDGERLELRSRAGHDLTPSFPWLGPPTARPVVLDGEVVALDADGRPSFGALQRRTGFDRDVGGPRDVAVFVFDLLGLDDDDLTDRPFSDRLAALDTLALVAPWHRTPGVADDGEALWASLLDQGFEGMVAKRLDAPYQPGVRSPAWRKVVLRRSARAIVVGYTPGEGGRARTFGSLVLAVGTPEGLRWVGQVGTGFDDTALALIRSHLDEMQAEEPLLEPHPDLPGGVVWVEPRLVAHVGYREWTSDGRLRHPSFKGFGPEVPEEVTWEVEGP